MNTEIKVKDEPIEPTTQSDSSQMKCSPELMYRCDRCGIQFRSETTRNTHREHFCTEQEARKASLKEIMPLSALKSAKRKVWDTSDSHTPSSKRFSDGRRFVPNPPMSSTAIGNLTHPLSQPIQLGQCLYIPIPIRPGAINSTKSAAKPLDLSKPKKIRSMMPLIDSTKSKAKNPLQTQIYPCDYCSVRFSSLKTLQAHQENYCLQYRKQVLDSIPVDRRRHQSNSKESSNDPPPVLLACHLCNYRGYSLRAMELHLKLHSIHQKTCSDDDTLPVALPIPIPSQILFKCFICSAMFESEEVLLNHMRSVHANEQSIECLACRSRFSSRWNLIRHLKLSHTNMKSDENHLDPILTNAKASKHSDNQKNDLPIALQSKSFTCPHCSVKFRRAETLKQHMTIYCSARPDKNSLSTNKTFCTVCEVSFQHQQAYEAHKLYYCPAKSSLHLNLEA